MDLRPEKIPVILKDKWGLPLVRSDCVRVDRRSLAEPFWKLPLFQKSDCRVYWTPQGRWIQYSCNNRLLMRKSRGRWHLIFDFEDEEKLMQVSRLFYLSWLGLQKELKGHFRLHAAGLGFQDQCALFWGPPGAGKTTLTHHFLKTTQQPVLGDELCFYRNQEIEGVPLHLHFKKKKEDEVAAHSPIPPHRFQPRAQLRILYCLDSQRTEQGRVSTFSGPQKIRLASRMLMGEGLHQMAEFHLRWDQFFILFNLACIRLVAVLHLFRRTEIKRLQVPHFHLQKESEIRSWIESLIQSSFRS